MLLLEENALVNAHEGRVFAKEAAKVGSEVVKVRFTSVAKLSLRNPLFTQR